MNYLFLADGFETVEALTPVDMMRRAAIPVTTVSISSATSVVSSHRVKVEADITFDKADFSDAKMLILPGGMPGSNNLRAHDGLCELLKDHAAKGGDVAAICAAPFILGELGILEGKKATCYPGFEERLIGAQTSEAPVVCDGNCITSRGMGTAIEFGGAIVEKLSDKETADRIKKSIIYSV
ncbi:MAG: DJ-1/PfpI family protein [Lachnospiraceae bacterium]|nr:DJ-1/PfpI family protein [Lachnospiraceae bacterium]